MHTRSMREVEAAIRECADRGDFKEAARLALEGYGDEVYGFLVVRMRGEQDASDVFSDLTEDMWRGLPGFAFRCSFRTWMYVLARNAASRFEKVPTNQRRRRVTISRLPEGVDRSRTATKPYLRTDAKDELSVLRDKLDPDEQTLLVLRLDRRLSWADVALVLSDVENPSPDELKRLAARYRKRFGTIKQRLSDLAVEHGLLGNSP
jgi:RNA polymerase sigma-70 factor (ECF subfamily)